MDLSFVFVLGSGNNITPNISDGSNNTGGFQGSSGGSGSGQNPNNDRVSIHSTDQNDNHRRRPNPFAATPTTRSLGQTTMLGSDISVRDKHRIAKETSVSLDARLLSKEEFISLLEEAYDNWESGYKNLTIENAVVIKKAFAYHSNLLSPETKSRMRHLTHSTLGIECFKSRGRTVEARRDTYGILLYIKHGHNLPPFNPNNYRW